MKPVRTILHLDLDAFFASVEQLDFPELRGKPVAVGSRSPRGVVAAASYEARKYGVHSAMPMRQALERCRHLCVMPPRSHRYRELSEEVFSIYACYTDLIQPLSIDEAFLDVTASRRLLGTGEEIAARIKAEVRNRTGLVVSAGVAPNKFLAKLATDLGKPDGLFVIDRSNLDEVLLPLPVSRMWGVGEKTAGKLKALGIQTFADLRRMDAATLVRQFGKQGAAFYHLSRGEDERPVSSEEGVKSISQEETFERDIHSVDKMCTVLLRLAEKVGFRARKKGLQGRCVTLKVRYGDFSTPTRSRTLEKPVQSGIDIYRVARELLGETEAHRRAVRLIGVGISSLEAPGAGQGSLFASEGAQEKPLDCAMDEVLNRFGKGSIRRGTLLEEDESE